MFQAQIISFNFFDSLECTRLTVCCETLPTKVKTKPQISTFKHKGIKGVPTPPFLFRTVLLFANQKKPPF